MATVKELKATARPKAGKGAARAERRAGRVPAVIYGDNQPPVTISLEDKALRQSIFAGHFLTTIYNIDLEGKKHRVIPRDFALDPVKDFPIHVDFLRLGQGATIRVSVPLHVIGAEVSPGVKRGGTVNIVNHTVDLEADVEHIPQYIEVDVSKLEINNSLHLSDVKLPKGVKAISRDDQTLVTVVPPSGFGEEAKPARRRKVRLLACGRCCACGRCRGSGWCEGSRGWCREGARSRRRQEEVSNGGLTSVSAKHVFRDVLRRRERRSKASVQGFAGTVEFCRRHARTRILPPCACLSDWAIPDRNPRSTGTTSGSWLSI